MAKAAVQQFGGSDCPVTAKLSQTSAKRAEDACHKLFFAYLLAHLSNMPFVSGGDCLGSTPLKKMPKIDPT